MRSDIEIERVIPGAPAPEWWDRMWDLMDWCEADAPEPPTGFTNVWGCYRAAGHTGRHMGLASVNHDSSEDAWVIWS